MIVEMVSNSSIPASLSSLLITTLPGHLWWMAKFVLASVYMDLLGSLVTSLEVINMGWWLGVLINSLCKTLSRQYRLISNHLHSKL